MANHSYFQFDDDNKTEYMLFHKKSFTCDKITSNELMAIAIW